jgi:predicted PurR-regulated permease PerM
MPLPTDPKTILLGGLFALALLTAADVAGEIVLPLVFAFIPASPERACAPCV